MRYILSLLPLLACPVGMGLMMWLMMRGNKNQETQAINQARGSNYREVRTAENEASRGTSILKMLFMCLNWKVVAGLAVVGLGILILAPQYLWVALPVLIVAACPLSMLFMMRGMSNSSPAPGAAQDARLPELQSRLSSLQAEQEAVASQIAELEHSSSMPEARVKDERNEVRARRR